MADFQLLTYLQGDSISSCSLSQAGWWNCNKVCELSSYQPLAPTKGCSFHEHVQLLPTLQESYG